MAKIVDYDGTRHEFPDDFTDAEIAAALSDATTAGPRPVLNRNRSWGQGMFRAIPLAAAGAGMALGGPGGGITGGILGKGAQEYALQFVPGMAEFMEEDPHSTSEQAFNIAREGVGQVGAAAGGVVTSGISRGIGRALMRSATPQAASLSRAYRIPDIADVMERERVGAGRGILTRIRGGEAGSDVAARRSSASGRKMRELLRDAQKGGWKTTAPSITRRSRALAQDLAENTDVPSQGTKMGKMIRNFHRQQSTPRTLSVGGASIRVNIPREIGAERAGKILRASARAARNEYQKAVDRVPTTPGEQLLAGYRKANADELREMMGKTIPGFTSRNQLTREALALEDALREIEKTRSGADLMMVPAALRLATPAMARARPFVQRAGLALTNRYLLDVLRGMPQLVKYGFFDNQGVRSEPEGF